MTRAEQLKKRLLADETVLGCNVVMTEPAVSDLLGKAGCEFVWIDMEHGAIDYKDAMYHVIAYCRSHCRSINTGVDYKGGQQDYERNY